MLLWGVPEGAVRGSASGGPCRAGERGEATGCGGEEKEARSGRKAPLRAARALPRGIGRDCVESAAKTRELEARKQQGGEVADWS